MQEVLNFQKEDKKKLSQILSVHPKTKTSTSFEELRVKYMDCTITLYSSGKLVIQGDKHKEVASEILSNFGMPSQIIVGIDETGRGEKEGPFVVSAVLADKSKLLSFRDSKKTADISSAASSVTEKALSIATFSVNAELIDILRAKGMNMNEIQATAIDSAAYYFRSLWPEAEIIVDGSPIKTKTKNLNFTIKADDINPVVGAASIIAKETRDASKDKKERKTWKSS